MVTSSYVPKCGDVVWVSFNPQAGHEQSGHRPGLVLSPESYNRTVGLALICPITNRKKGYPFEVQIPPNPSVSGVILSDHIRSVDWKARGATKITSLPDNVVNRVLGRLMTLLTR